MNTLEGETKRLTHKIGFIGGGNMAKAICEAFISKGIVSNEKIYVSGPHLQNLTWWTEKGCNVFCENEKVVNEVDVIFICVKPHVLSTAFVGISQKVPKLYISILAGITLDTLSKELSLLNGRIIRVMPNTPMSVGEGCCLFSPGPTANNNDIELVTALLSVTGTCKQVPENLLNTAGALTASGPAFIFMVIEALADGAVKMGVPRAFANQFAAQMTLGSAKMARDSGKHTAQLKDEVCSPGGTTIQGVYALESRGIRAALMDAVESTAKRAEELRLASKEK